MGITAIRLYPDPYLSDAEYFAQRRLKPGPHVGKAPVMVNLSGLIGGLARIEERTQTQEQAAARYRLLFERAELSGLRAFDASRLRVDGGGPGGLSPAEIGLTARRDYREAVQHLGLVRSQLVERVVVHEQALGAIAGRSGAARAKAKRDLLAALDALAVHFGLMPKPA